ncbi:hypothetical protein V8C42DRAFT_341390 [Trichoderma barbatum]
MHAPDPEDVKRALLAELGRARQDELPLSSVAKRPTYQPRGSGTSHIPQARKEKLESKWGVKIVDEESQQMEGLELGSSRPWAQITNQYMARHVIESAPPRLAMAAQHARPFAIPKAPSGPKPVSQNMNTPAKRHRKPTPSATHKPTEHVLSQGECEIVDEFDNSSVAAKFVAKVHIQRNEGLLIITPSGKPECVYNVLSLGIPAIQGPFCIIYGARNERLHKVKLRTSAAAESFQYLLKSLQQSARQFGEPRSTSPKPSSAVANTKEQEASPLQTPSQSALKTQEGIPEAVGGNANASTPTPGSIEAPLQQESQENLVNLEDEPDQQPSLTMEAAADHMQRIVQQILSEITATGVMVPETGVEEIESTAIANWMAQGFMTSETGSDELKDELVELLRLLVRIKRKVQYRHGVNPVFNAVVNAGSNDVSISSATLQDLQEISEKPSKRIKYTTADIKELETQAMSRQDKIKASGLQEIQKSSPAPDEPKKKMAPAEVSSSTPKAPVVLESSTPEAYAGVVSSAPKVPSGPSNSGPKSTGGLATSRWATVGGRSAPTPTATTATKPKSSPLKATAPIFQSQKPGPKGLSSSRWADMPVENNGAFAGF